MNVELHLGRQPIVDRHGQLYAYELLFRHSRHNQAQVDDDAHATAQVIQNVFAEFGAHRVLGDKRGFINLSAELLLSDTIELLPPESVVLEILETVTISDEIVARVRELHARGFQLALDDVLELSAPYLPLLPYLSFIKIDLLGVKRDQLPDIVRRFQAHSLTLLAEKVDSPEQFEFCKALGFTLFQGYYFARPTVLSTQKGSNTSNMALLRLLGLLNRDASDKELADGLQASPQLSFSLLKLVNSVSCGAPCHIDSINHALTLLGRQQLARWVQLLLFTHRPQPGSPSDDPLTGLAIFRARIMQLLAQRQQPGKRVFSEQAFMVGLLSLLDTLYSQPLPDLLAPLQLQDEVRDALLQNAGALGLLLQQARALDGSGDDVPVLDAADDQLLLDAMDWTTALLAELGQP